MKSPMPWSIVEPTIAVLPPELSNRVQSHFGKKARRGHISHRALEPLWRRYMEEPAFCERIHAISDGLCDAVFDPENREWGEWPTDLQEIIAVGVVLGVCLETTIDDVLLRLPAEELSFVEEQCKERSLSIAELLIDRLLESKQSGVSWEGREA